MQNDFAAEFWRGLKFQLPYILAYLVGIMVTLIYYRRCPQPCLYAFLACTIKLTVAIVYPLTEAYLLLEGEFALFEPVTVAIALIDASAYGLLLVAVFSDRRPRPPRRFLWPDEMEPDDGGPPGDDAGFHEHKPR